MKTEMREVKSGVDEKTKERKLVATVPTPVYDTLDEARQAEGDKKVLELFNTQNATNIMNLARAQFNTTPSKKKITEDFIDELADGSYDLAGDADYQAAKGDKVRLAAWREKIINERFEAAKANLTAQGAKQEEAAASGVQGE